MKPGSDVEKRMQQAVRLVGWRELCPGLQVLSSTLDRCDVHNHVAKVALGTINPVYHGLTTDSMLTVRN
jgi:hypothetical protein